MPYKTHAVFTPPIDVNSSIWRYLDFTKYVSLLHKSELYFAVASSLEDPFEGTYPRLDATTDITTQINRKRFRDFIAVNCWHLNEKESAAMWSLYLKSNEGVAVKTTFRNLCDSISDSKSVLIGEIKYLDYDSEQLDANLNMYGPYVCKRNEFSHEREIRAVMSRIRDFNSKKDGYSGGDSVEVDLDVLIQEVVISPTAPAWFRLLVENITNKYGMNFPVKESDLIKKPGY